MKKHILMLNKVKPLKNSALKEAKRSLKMSFSYLELHFHRNLGEPLSRLNSLCLRNLKMSEKIIYV